MQYQAVILDQERGLYKTGLGGNPPAAVLKAWREILKDRMGQSQADKIDSLGTNEVIQGFRMSSVEDSLMEDTVTLREPVNETKMLIMRDNSKEYLFTPCGWVTPKI